MVIVIPLAAQVTTVHISHQQLYNDNVTYFQIMVKLLPSAIEKKKLGTLKIFYL